mmetsp:Transcript_18946/g.52207  ORF Transcript_18946/g.52207 Transcript_18946/m.52207 type:complete len:247 (-) Transcript_18946:1241-1981(-)
MWTPCPSRVVQASIVTGSLRRRTSVSWVFLGSVLRLSKPPSSGMPSMRSPALPAPMWEAAAPAAAAATPPAAKAMVARKWSSGAPTRAVATQWSLQLASGSATCVRVAWSPSAPCAGRRRTTSMRIALMSNPCASSGSLGSRAAGTSTLGARAWRKRAPAVMPKLQRCESPCSDTRSSRQTSAGSPGIAGFALGAGGLSRKSMVAVPWSAAVTHTVGMSNPGVATPSIGTRLPGTTCRWRAASSPS